MKIEIRVHCTPQEARTFMGLPDVQPVQEEMMERVATTLREGMSPTEAFNMMKPFMAPNTQALDAMQKAFFNAFSSAGYGNADKD
jgi:hypothetical protein